VPTRILRKTSCLDLALDRTATPKPIATLEIDRRVAVESDGAGNVKPSKKLSTARIDLVAALVMAVDRMDRNRIAPTAPTYEVMWMGAP